MDWLASEGVKVTDVTTPALYRFFRVVGGASSLTNSDDDHGDASLIQEVCTDIGVPLEEVKRVGWLPEGPFKALRFYRLPAEAPLARSRAMRNGRIQVFRNLWFDDRN